MTRTLAVWVLFIPVAILNGALREGVLAPFVGTKAALPLSGVLLSCLIFLTTYLLYHWLKATPGQSWAIGVAWLILTVMFELGFGHYVMGKPWRILLGQFDVQGGNLWALVLFVVLMSPWLVSRLRGKG